ncbi:MAG: hypothetical protein RML72_04475, partial [Bacteroidia bacterium]|nr:hypothetical protein [Bacteroidia bacterium]MDW8158118.1 hypothetical protein [Bacteroidia bacterium]
MKKIHAKLILEAYKPLIRALSSEGKDFNVGAEEETDYDKQVLVEEILKQAHTLAGLPINNLLQAYTLKPLPLVFNSLSLSAIELAPKPQSKKITPIQPLNIYGSIEHYYQELESTDITDAIQELKKQFQKEYEYFLENTQQNQETRLSTLQHLLRKYAYCIGIEGVTGCSAFEFTKSIAAFAIAIYENQKFLYFSRAPQEFYQKYPFLFVGADISGIQNFIYDIVTKGASKNLKGRSFYLQLLTDCTAQLVLHKVNIRHSCPIVYSSGGKFFMLLPHTPEVVQILEEIQKEIEKELWNLHKGKLYLSFGYVPFALQVQNGVQKVSIPEDYLENKFVDSSNLEWSTLWQTINHITSKRKQKKFLNLIASQENFTEFFGEEISSNLRKGIGRGGDLENDPAYRICSITGEEIDVKEEFYSLIEPEDYEESMAEKKKKALSTISKKILNLGDDLQSAYAWVRVPSNKKAGKYFTIFNIEGAPVYQ